MEEIKNFRILQSVISATEWYNANNIVLICAVLSNLEPPLVTKKYLKTILNSDHKINIRVKILIGLVHYSTW